MKPFPSICFVALNGYSLFERSNRVRHIGGAEAQQYEMACYLRDKGYRVSFIVKDHGQPREFEQDGIRIRSAYRSEAGLPILRFFHPRWSGLANAMSAVDAQIYYQRSSGSETGQVALWCQRHGRRFIYGVASEGDCVPELPFIGRLMDRRLFRLGLSKADRVIAQTAHQAELLKTNFDVDAKVVPNVVRAPDAEFSATREPNSVLWVGRIAPVKRVEWIVAIAAAQPRYQFRLVGGVNNDTEYAKRLIEQLRRMPNVSLVPSMPRSQLFEEYRRASVLLLTSQMEGFPNVFIESWLSGTPVLSTFDPDNLVRTHGLGWIATTQAELIEKLEGGLFSSLDEEAQCRARVAAYATAKHSPEQVLPRFEAQLQALA